MYHCNLSRTPAIPVLSRVSRRSKCLKPSSIIDPSPQTPTIGSGLNPSPASPCKTLASGKSRTPRYISEPFLRRPSANSCFALKVATFSSGPPLKARVFYLNLSRGIRGFSSSSQNARPGSDRAGEGRQALPWIASYRDSERKGVEKKKTAARTDRSSWEESADSYFSRHGRKLPTESVDDVEEDSKEEEEDGGDDIAEPTEDPRWNRIKGRFKGFVERESREDRGNVNAEPTKNPRWNRMKSRYNGFVERESRFEKPEVQRWSKQENWGRQTWKEATESSSVPKMVGQGVYGVGPVLAALTIGRREFYALYVQEGLDLSSINRKKKDKKGVEKVLRMAEKIGLKVVEASKHDLNMVVDNRPHQGLVLDASPLEMVNIKELDPVSSEGHKAPLWVALDEVTDPQNLGGIIRSAYFFGAEGVVLCAKNSAPLSGVVSKASAGSLELIELRSCKNMMQFLSSSIENGWRVLGGSVSSRALPLSEVEAAVPTVLVLGSEGSGLRPLVERSCTQLIRIPGNIQTDGNVGGTEVEAEEIVQSCVGQELKSFLAVESLNVSVAAGVLLHHLTGNNGHLVSDKPDVSLE